MSNSAITFGSTNLTLQGAVGFKNKIINGNFDIWQRGTSQTATGYGSDDRWVNDHAGSTKTASRQTFTLGQTDVSGNPQYFSRTVVTSVAGASNNVFKNQRIEGVRTFAGQTVTLSFWAKADASKNMAIEFAQVFGSGGSPSASVTGISVNTCNLTTAWKKFTVTTTLPSISGKTIGTSGDDALYLLMWFDAGSSFNARTNSLGQQSGTFDIAQVQLEEGTIATPFENRPVGAELALCQRYFEKSYNLDTALQSNTTGGLSIVTARATTSASTEGVVIAFKVSKFKTPAITTYRRDGGAGSQWRYNTSTYAAITTDVIGQNSFGVYFNGTAAGLVSNNAVTIDGHWTADAEL